MKHSFWRWARLSAVSGLSVAAVFFAALKLLGTAYPYPAFRLMLFLWPSSVFLMATDGSENTLGSYFIVLVAILANGLTYFIVSSVLWAGSHVSRRWIRS